jgi:hypothetical protein
VKVHVIALILALGSIVLAGCRVGHSNSARAQLASLDLGLSKNDPGLLTGVTHFVFSDELADVGGPAI